MTTSDDPCQSILDAIDALNQSVLDLQAQLEGAGGPERTVLMRRIAQAHQRINDEQKALQRCRQHPPVPEPPSDLTALQGLRGNTLVAGKTTALRVFVNKDVVSNSARIDATVIRPDGSQVTPAWSSNSFVKIPNSSAGPSLVAVVPGSDVPWTGAYSVRLRVSDSGGAVLHASSLDNVRFLPTKDLRVLVARLWPGGTPFRPGEVDVAHTAMQRLSWLYPVRDGVSALDGDRTSGLRYSLFDGPIGPPNQDAHLCPLFAQWSHRPAPLDSIDVAITYRFPNAGDPSSGGNSPHFCPGQTVPYSIIVWGAPLANVFCQETAHAFGLEAPQSPHLDPSFDSHHSKDEKVDPTDLDLGFDTQFNAPWPVPTYDVMYPSGPDPEYPDAAHSLNSWDWEFLRQQLMKLPS